MLLLLLQMQMLLFLLEMTLLLSMMVPMLMKQSLCASSSVRAVVAAVVGVEWECPICFQAAEEAGCCQTRALFCCLCGGGDNDN